MPPKTSKASSAAAVAAGPVSDRFMMAQAMERLAKASEALPSTLEDFKSMTRDYLKRLELELEAKRAEHDATLADLENDLKRKRLEFDNVLLEKKMVAATEVLATAGFESVAKAELNELRKAATTAKAELEAALAAAARRAGEDLKAQLHMAELESRTKTATLTASVEQKDKEIGVLSAQLTSLTKELANQRELTKSVAEAGKGMITQNLAGSGRS